MQLSVVIPVRNEAENILPLLAEIQAALAGLGESEVVYVDDGSSDATPQRLAEAMRLYPNLRVLRHASSCGQSTALLTGVRAARGEWIATLDGDGQNDPADIPKLARGAGCGGGLVRSSGWWPGTAGSARTRGSSAFRRASRTGCARRLLGDATPDTGCGLKLVLREAYLRLPYFDHMHRFLPALVQRAGGHDGVGGGEPSAAHARARRTTACSTGCGSGSSISAACCGCSGARSGREVSERERAAMKRSDRLRHVVPVDGRRTRRLAAPCVDAGEDRGARRSAEMTEHKRLRVAPRLDAD